MRKILLYIFLIAFSQTAFAQTKIDEYGAIITDDEYFRLSHFVVEELKKDKDSRVTIIIYKDKSETTGKFLRHFYGVEDFLIKAFDISPDKFSVVFGGEDKRRTEIWLSKSKNDAIKFENKMLDETLAGKINQKLLFDYNCIDCDESPFINQFIFREGFDYLAKALKANPNTVALINIPKVEYVSKTAKEKSELLVEIKNRIIEKNEISKNRIKIQFTSGNFAFFYIIPQTVKIKENKF